MKPSDYSQRLQYGAIGLIGGLIWVYWCCRITPNIHPIIERGWGIVAWSLGLIVAGFLAMLYRRTTDVPRQMRELLFNIGIIVLIVGLIGLQLGLGMVLVICVKYLLAWEGWAVAAMIGWIVAIYSLICISDTLRAGD